LGLDVGCCDYWGEGVCDVFCDVFVGVYLVVVWFVVEWKCLVVCDLNLFVE